MEAQGRAENMTNCTAESHAEAQEEAACRQLPTAYTTGWYTSMVGYPLSIPLTNKPYL